MWNMGWIQGMEYGIWMGYGIRMGIGIWGSGDMKYGMGSGIWEYEDRDCHGIKRYLGLVQGWIFVGNGSEAY